MAPKPAPAAEKPAPLFTRMKLWLTGLIGVLVVLPSVINAGVDVYSSLLKLPKTEAERINEKLFRENFGKQPVATVPVPIKQNNGVVEVRFDIYEKGDVFVQFGSFTQWFPFPSPTADVKTPVGFSLMSSAFAQTPPTQPVQGMGSYQQTDQMQGDTIKRQKIYQNGVVENQVIDTRSGGVLNYSSRQIDPAQSASAPSAPLTVHKVAPIDLDQYRKTTQSTSATALWQQALATELAWCEQKDWAVGRYVCIYRATNKWCDQADAWGKTKECVK
jgi:hypothetical protein